MFRLILLCFSLRLCIRKFYCGLKKIVVYREISLSSEKDCCVLEKIVVFQKRNLVVFCPYRPPYERANLQH